MKKLFLTSIIITVCVALYAAVWPQSAGDGKVPGGPAKSSVSAEIETKPEETPSIIFSTDNHASESEIVAESALPKIDITSIEEKTEPTPPPKLALMQTAVPSSDPKPSMIAIVDGEQCMWIPGFGWVKDEGGGSIGIPVDGEGDINKQIGVMGGGATVGNPGDELTGHKVGIMGGGTVTKDMYESGVKIGIMGGEETPTEKIAPPQAELPEPTGEVIYIELQPTPTKNSTPPDYRPGQ
jgi:hypothetical protein